MNKPLLYSIIIFCLAGGVCAADSQPARRTPDKGFSDCQGLIRANLELRKQLKALGKKYTDLENERGVLILHIKELQNTKDLTAKAVEDLEKRIASLKGEMLKDPNLTKTIDLLNQKVNDTRRERDRLREKLEALGPEKEKLAGDLGELKKKNAALAGELEETRASWRAVEAALKGEVKKVRDEKAALAKKNRELAEALEKLEEARRLAPAAEQEPAPREAGSRREANRLKKELAKAQSENQKLAGELARLEERVREGGEITRRLMRDLKKEQAALARAEKALNAETRKRASEKKGFEKKLKDALADKMMFEAGARQWEERALAAERKLGGLEKDLETASARAGLRESEAAVLREEKSRLEQKLVRYIEKLMEREAAAPRGILQAKKTAPDAQAPRPDQGAGSKQEMIRRKLDMHYNLALAYDKRGMYREEEKEYLKCLKINPRDANVHYNLGILYDDKLNKNRKAVAHYKKFLQLRPVGEDAERVKRWILHAEQEERLGAEVR